MGTLRAAGGSVKFKQRRLRKQHSMFPAHLVHARPNELSSGLRRLFRLQFRPYWAILSLQFFQFVAHQEHGRDAQDLLYDLKVPSRHPARSGWDKLSAAFLFS